MTLSRRFLVRRIPSPSLLAIALFGVAGLAGPARAATEAGTVVNHTIQTTYKVSGVDQPQAETTVSFTVDRVINMSLVRETTGRKTRDLLAGTTNAYARFTFTNLSNTTLDFSVVATGSNVASVVDGLTANSAMDGAVTVYLDDGDGVFESNQDAVLNFLDNVPQGGVRTIWLAGNIPADATNSYVAIGSVGVRAFTPANVGTLGTAITESRTGALGTQDTFFGEPAGFNDPAKDGVLVTAEAFTVKNALLTYDWITRVLSDLTNGATNPKAIPGASMEYCLTVANGATGATADTVTISIPVPTVVTYDATYGIKTGGTLNAGSCSAGAGNGALQTVGGQPTVTGSLGSIAAGETKTVIFRGTIN